LNRHLYNNSIDSIHLTHHRMYIRTEGQFIKNDSIRISHFSFLKKKGIESFLKQIKSQESTDNIINIKCKIYYQILWP